MSEVEWIKIRVNIFEDEKIRLIEALPDGDTLVVIWVKMLTHAGKINDRGYIYLKEGTPYTPQMLSIVYNRPQPVIDLALKTFQDFGMIEIDERGIRIVNWEKHQNVDGLERIREQTRERVRKYREKQKLKNQLLPKPKEGNVTCNVTETQSNALDKEKDIDKEKDKDDVGADAPLSPSNNDYTKQIQEIWDHYVKTFDGFFPRGLTLTVKRKKQIENRLKDKNKSFSVDDIKLAISNIRQSPFHCGDNPNKKFYATIEFVCRSPEKVEEWMNYQPNKVIQMPQREEPAVRPNASAYKKLVFD